jgi:hypothetical protein
MHDRFFTLGHNAIQKEETFLQLGASASTQSQEPATSKA